jgi:uncharacterized protein (TIGR02246 family)
VDDIEAIRQLKARYFRLMDTKDWAAMREVFTPDVHVEIADNAAMHDGVEPFMAMLEEALRDVVTVHHGHMPEIEVTSPTTATGIWAMEDHLRFPAGGPISELHGYGHYRETYVKVDGQWRIQSLRLDRLRLDVT